MVEKVTLRGRLIDPAGRALQGDVILTATRAGAQETGPDVFAGAVRTCTSESSSSGGPARPAVFPAHSSADSSASPVRVMVLSSMRTGMPWCVVREHRTR